jgi:aspartate racemase
MWSFDFGEIEALQQAGRWDDDAAEMIAAAQRLERGGAAIVVICANAMHRMADQVQAAISLPLLPIRALSRSRPRGFAQSACSGRAFTMEQDFYKGRLRSGRGSKFWRRTTPTGPRCTG